MKIFAIYAKRLSKRKRDIEMTKFEMYMKTVLMMLNSKLSEDTMKKVIYLIGSENGTEENLQKMYKFFQAPNRTEEEVLEAISTMHPRSSD